MKGHRKERRRRIVVGALICASISAVLVYGVRLFFPGVLESGDAASGEAFAAGYLAIVVIVPLIVMLSLASLTLATLGALAREKLVTFLTLVVIALTWTLVSPQTVQDLLVRILEAPQNHASAVVFLAIGLVVYLIPVFFLIALRPRQERR